MATPATPLDTPRAVDISAIESELSALWKHANADRADTITRVRVLNLVAGVANDDAAAHATEVVAQLTTRHPNRAIMLNIAADDGADSLNAWVQAHCQVPGHDQQQVCCEQITIAARGKTSAHVPGVVLPLLVPDVPVMLWWPQGVPLDAPFFQRLCSFADRVIIDSATFDSPEPTFMRLPELLHAGHALSDLTWSRLTPWREITAQCFDSPITQPHLAKISAITLRYFTRAGEHASRIPALLLIGWLASRLGWTLAEPPRTENGSTLLALKRGDGTVAVTLQPKERPADIGHMLCSLALEAPGATFKVAHEQAQHLTTSVAQIADHEPLRHGVRIEPPTEAGLLGEELGLLNRDKGFEAAMRFVVQALQS